MKNYFSLSLGSPRPWYQWDYDYVPINKMAHNCYLCKMSRKRSVVLGIALGASAVITIGVAAARFAYHKFKKHEFYQKDRSATHLTHCTCRLQMNTCERHNQELLYEISQVISNPELMWKLGIELGFKFQAIEGIYRQNKDFITATAYVMLQKWYLEKKELNVLVLKDVLDRLKLERFNEEIIDRHFERRQISQS